MGALLAAAALAGAAGAAIFPIYVESSSLLYKFGADRRLLLAAHSLGLLGGYLLLIQLIAGARLKSLDRIFGLNNLFRFHRCNGLAIACLVTVHPVLIFISDDRVFIPLQLRYWPEFVGLLMLLSIVVTAVLSQWRKRFKLPFHRWWPVHRNAAIFILAAYWVHLHFVNETFRQGFAAVVFWTGAGLCALILLWARARPLLNGRHPFSVVKVKAAGKDALRLVVEPTKRNLPAYAPGQFGFIRPCSGRVAREEHPFTIASTPTRTDAFEFFVRTTGDWTATLDRLQPGDVLAVDGPFGLFSHVTLPAGSEIVMVAGGIGITPMLSMLRFMADRNDQRKVTLIWSNRTRAHILGRDEFRKLSERLTNFKIFHILTRENTASGQKRRLDRSQLAELLSDCSRRSAVFVCGPRQMMKTVSRALASLGFQRRRIFSERFGL